MYPLMKNGAQLIRVRIATLLLALMITPTAALAQNYKPGFNIFSTRQDYEIGRQSAAAANRQLRTYRDARVSRIGKRLEIGRASCRERGWVGGGAVAMK